MLNIEENLITVEPRFNELLLNEVLDISIEQSYGTEPRFNEILVITNTIDKRHVM